MSAHHRLIVNADDFGRTPGINAGVIDAHRRGIVTSATLMVGYPAAAAAAQLARAYPSLGLGMHVTFSGARSVADPASVPSLVDADGKLPARPEALRNADPADVTRELDAQLRRFQSLVGQLPTHLDGHHHCHRVPVVLGAVVAAALTHGLPVRRVTSAVAARLRHAGVATTDVFVDTFYGDGVSVETLEHTIGRIAEGTTELMCHPARVDQALREDSDYADLRATEVAVLTHPTVVAAIRRSEISLAHFGEL